jgi:probable selenium-dependent hydroxylase accessory protein YqeC
VRFIDVITIVPGTVVSFVGCGGKTSVIEVVMKELRDIEIPLIHTTTTKIWLPEAEDRQTLISESLTVLKKEINKAQKKVISIGSGKTEDGKLVGIPDSWVKEICLNFPHYCVLVEADGCKGKSIKLYGDNEPCIPKESHTTVILLGLDAFEDRNINEIVHRPECFLENFETKHPSVEERVRSLFWTKGLVSGARSDGDKYVFLNKVTDEKLLLARAIARKILDVGEEQLTGVMLGDTRAVEICKEVML